jgi:hypothetical protein
MQGVLALKQSRNIPQESIYELGPKVLLLLASDMRAILVIRKIYGMRRVHSRQG